MTENKVKELLKALDEDPSSKAFLELARLLAEQDTAKARDILIQGLYYHSDNLVARLLLAKIFYKDGLYNFSAREIAEVWMVSKSDTIKKLLLSFGEHGEKYYQIYSGSAVESESEDVLAEIDLDADISDAIIEFDDES